jgi:integrase
VKANAIQAQKPVFQKTEVPCLYRYSSNGVYYALVKHEGKQKRAFLETTDKAVAKRKLADFQRDLGKVNPSQGRVTLRELCDKYLLTVQNQAPATVYRKKHIVERLLNDFPGGADAQISKIRQSSLETWLATYKFGYASQTLYVLLLKALFDLAVNDKMLLESPAAKLECKKVVKPIRVTPTFEEFSAIVADVRQQKWNSEAQASADFLEFMGLVGVGQAEITGLQRQHVNLAKGQITFFRQKTKTPYTVPIYPQAEALVKKLVGKAEMKQTDFLFPINLTKSKNVEAEGKSKDGKKSLQAACKRLGYPAYTQRSLRRMFITRCIEKGVDVKVIAQWQGHQDGGKLILGTYSHVRNVHSEEMAKKLV